MPILTKRDLENIAGKGENAASQYFLFRTMVSTASNNALALILTTFSWLLPNLRKKALENIAGKGPKAGTSIFFFSPKSFYWFQNGYQLLSKISFVTWKCSHFQGDKTFLVNKELTYSQTTNSNWKSVQATILNLMKMAESSPERPKTLWEKEKSLIASNFCFPHSVFKRQKQGLVFENVNIWTFTRLN